MQQNSIVIFGQKPKKLDASINLAKSPLF